MGLHDLYYSLEEKYYSALDWLDSKGVPVYKIVEPIDKHMPSFIIVLVVFALLFLGIVFAIFASFGIFPTAHNIIVTFEGEDGARIADLDVRVESETIDSFLANTGSTGAISLQNAKVGSRLSLSGEYFGNNFSKEILVNDDTTYNVTLDGVGATTNINFTLSTLDGTALKPVNITFSCSNSDVNPPRFLAGYTQSNVSVSVANRCGTLGVNIESDYYSTLNESVREGDVIELSSMQSVIGHNTLTVNIFDEFGESVEGATVNVTQGTLGLQVDGGYSANMPTSLFQITGLIVETYKVTVSKQGYVTATEYVTFESDYTSETIDVTLSDNVDEIADGDIGYISVVVLGADLTELEGATVKFYGYMGEDKNEIYAPQVTDENGSAEAEVEAGYDKYTVQINKSGYYPREYDVTLNPTSPEELELYRLGAGRSIRVKVVDGEGEPINNASIYVYDSDGYVMSVPKQLTDTNGDVEHGLFVEEGIYKIYASKGYYSAMSSSIDFVPQSSIEDGEYDVIVNMPLPSSSMTIDITDPVGNKVPNAIVEIYDSYGAAAEFIGAKHSNSDGVFSATGLRADKKIFFVVRAEGFENYVSIADFLVPESDNKFSVKLERPALSQEPKFEVLGVYTPQDQSVQKVAQGEVYKVKYKMTLPQGDDGYERFVTSFIAGELDTVSKESFYIESVKRSGFSTILKGSRYSEIDSSYGYEGSREVSFEADEGDAFVDEAKWVQSEYYLKDYNIDSGVFFADVYFRVRDSARINERLVFMYHMASENDDGDIVLTDGATTSQSRDIDDLYVPNPKVYVVYAGTSEIVCEDDFCTEARILDNEEDLISNLSADTPYIASVGNEYTLSFSILNNMNKPLTSYRISVENPQKTLMMYDSKITSATGTEVRSEELLADEVGKIINDYKVVHTDQDPTLSSMIPKGQGIRGDINFEPNALGTSSFKISVVEDRQVIYEKEYYVNVYADKNMSVEIEPQVIPSYYPLNLTVRANDTDSGKGIEGASIKIHNAEGISLREPLSVTNGAGVANIEIPAQKPNETLFISVLHEDYTPYETSIKVAKEFLEFDTEELNITAKVSDRSGSADLVITNNSAIGVLIDNLSLEGNFDEYISTRVVNDSLDNYIGDKIPGTSEFQNDFRLRVNIPLANNAIDLENNTEYRGKLNLKVRRDDTNSVWYYSIPVKIIISLGDGLDNANCLNLDVKDGLLVSTDTRQVHDMLTITNDCTVNGNPVEIENIEAKLEWGSEVLGNLVFGEEDRSKSIRTSYFRTLALSMPPEYEETYTVNLVPKSGRITGEGTVDVVIRGSYTSSSGIEFVENAVSYDTQVIRLKDCISFDLPDGESDLIKTPRDVSSEFIIHNLCDTRLDLRLSLVGLEEASSETSFLEIRPTELSIPASGEQKVIVDPKDSPAGVYPLEVRAKTKGNTYEGVRVGDKALRVFLQPKATDCLIMDNYEFDLYDLVDNATDDSENMRFGYIINRCYEVPVVASYDLKVKTGGWGDASAWGSTMVTTASGLLGGITGAFNKKEAEGS